MREAAPMIGAVGGEDRGVRGAGVYGEMCSVPCDQAAAIGNGLRVSGGKVHGFAKG